MNTVLIILIFYASESVHSLQVPMYNMRACTQAALVAMRQDLKVIRSSKSITAFCVENGL